MAQIVPVRQTQSRGLIARGWKHTRPEDLALEADTGRHRRFVTARDVDVITLREDGPLHIAYAAGDAGTRTRDFTREFAGFAGLGRDGTLSAIALIEAGNPAGVIGAAVKPIVNAVTGTGVSRYGETFKHRRRRRK